MPTFSLQDRDLEWASRAPIVLTSTYALAAPPERVFERLADLGSWADWYGGMKKVTIDGASSGVGALRTVWVGATRVQERFVAWVPGRRMAFVITATNTPGMAAMVEDWAVAADPADPSRSVLTVTIGVEPARLLRPVKGVLRAVMKSATKGAAGITTQFA